MARYYDPTSPLSKRGEEWEAKLLSNIQSAGWYAVDSWEYITQIRPHFSNIQKAKITQRIGDILSKGSSSDYYFECVVCLHENILANTPYDTGIFPVSKIDNFKSQPEKSKEMWYAFLISSDGTGNNGEEIYIKAETWNAYASKMPSKVVKGREYKLFKPSHLRGIVKSVSSFSQVIS